MRDDYQLTEEEDEALKMRSERIVQTAFAASEFIKVRLADENNIVDYMEVYDVISILLGTLIDATIKKMAAYDESEE